MFCFVCRASDFWPSLYFRCLIWPRAARPMLPFATLSTARARRSSRQRFRPPESSCSESLPLCRIRVINAVDHACDSCDQVARFGCMHAVLTPWWQVPGAEHGDERAGLCARHASKRDQWRHHRAGNVWKEKKKKANRTKEKLEAAWSNRML